MTDAFFPSWADFGLRVPEVGVGHGRAIGQPVPELTEIRLLLEDPAKRLAESHGDSSAQSSPVVGEHRDDRLKSGEFDPSGRGTN
jgi:hypothetical protein